MGELMLNNDVAMTSLEVVELINGFRKEEGNKIKKEHKTFMRDIRNEIEYLKKADIKAENNFVPSSYIDKNNQERPCYKMNKAGIMQMLNKESALVRYKTQQYIEALEDRIEEQRLQITEKEKCILAIYNGGQEGILASKRLVEIETKPLVDKIEEDKPKVTFANRVIKSGDNILVRELAKIVSDEGVTIGERRLYARLREWGYICKNSTEPTQRAMNQNYFVVQVGTIKTPYGIKETKTTKVTPKGQIRIVERILEENKVEN
ncbi:phage regulatory protein/antirepressor Ant [Terrisporobacter sp.]|uniref:phage regulatory protein/antirepressor Ant n=1 Tax=Terrisporobacter sp. TaxID=1965305 RepID=UPI002629BBD8|nr:phage regulatory protein/antirepressor Ant [Terrisporobacter sp.]